MGPGKVDSTADIFKKVLNLLNDAKLAPDADMPFILDIESQLVSKIREPITNQQQQGVMPAPGAMSASTGGPSPMSAPMSAPMQPSVPMQGGGLMAGPSQPAAADELRRLLTRS